MLVSSRILACLLFAGLSLQGQTHTWTGNAGDNNWSTGANWASGTVPDSTSDVFLGTGSMVEITTAASLSTLLIDAEANLFVRANLTIADVVTIQNTGTLTWQDGRIIDGDIVNDGLMLIETFDEKILDNVRVTNYREVVMQNANNVRFLNNVRIHNTPQAVFSVASNGAISSQDTTTHLFLNEGLLEKVSNNNGDPGICYLIFDLENRGVLKTMPDQNFLILGGSFNFTNFEEGRIEGFRILDITSNFTNLGTYDPGSETTVGTIGVTNNFATSLQSTLVIDIQGVEPWAI